MIPNRPKLDIFPLSNFVVTDVGVKPSVQISAVTEVAQQQSGLLAAAGNGGPLLGSSGSGGSIVGGSGGGVEASAASGGGGGALTYVTTSTGRVVVKNSAALSLQAVTWAAQGGGASPRGSGALAPHGSSGGLHGSSANTLQAGTVAAPVIVKDQSALSKLIRLKQRYELLNTRASQQAAAAAGLVLHGAAGASSPAGAGLSASPRGSALNATSAGGEAMSPGGATKTGSAAGSTTADSTAAGPEAGPTSLLKLPTTAPLPSNHLLFQSLSTASVCAPVRTVEGVLIFHQHGHPHLMLLKYIHHNAVSGAIAGGTSQINPAAVSYRLPGGKCRTDEPEITCLLRKLGRRLLGFQKESLKTQPIPPTAGASTTSNSGGMTGTSGTGADVLFTGLSSPQKMSGHQRPSQGHANATTTAYTPERNLFGDADNNGGDKKDGLGNTAGGPAGGSVGVNAVGAATFGSGQFSSEDTAAILDASRSVFRVGEMLSQWHRPTFDRLLYPYVPAHVTHTKERRSVFLLHLADPANTTHFTVRYQNYFQYYPAALHAVVAAAAQASGSGGVAPVLPPAMPSGVTEAHPPYEVVAVPLFDIYQNPLKYGTVIESIPTTLSRFHINFCE